MDRRKFLSTTALGTVALGTATLPSIALAHQVMTDDSASTPSASTAAVRRILIMGGNYGTPVLRYMAQLTGKQRPRICYLPTASADNPYAIMDFYRNCAPLDVEAHVQGTFIESLSQTRGWDEVFLSMDAIVVSGGNTLNQQAIWKAQGIDTVLRAAWDKGVVLGGASAGSLCWFEEGTTDSRPKALSVVKCLGFLPGSHSPHYDAEAGRRPLYHKLIGDGTMKPGFACDNDAGILFEETAVKRIVSVRDGAKAYRVTTENGKVVEHVLQPERLA